MHSLQVLHRLSLLEDSAWDMVAARQSANVMGLLEQILLLLEKVHANLEACTGARESAWSKGAQILKQSLPKWSAGLDNMGVASTQETQQGADFDPTLFNLSDDSWYTDIFSSTAWGG